MRIMSDQRQRPEQARVEANASIHLLTYHGRRNYNAISYEDSLKLNAHIITTYFCKKMTSDWSVRLSNRGSSGSLEKRRS